MIDFMKGVRDFRVLGAPLSMYYKKKAKIYLGELKCQPYIRVNW